MKNDDEMYRSVLSRREEYRKKKEKRIRTIKRTVPVLACFFITIVFGLSYRGSSSELLKIPMHPNIKEEPSIVVTNATEPANIISAIPNSSTTENKSTKQTTSNSAAVSTTVIISETEINQTISAQLHQSQTVTTHDSVLVTWVNTQASVTTSPITQTKPITTVQITSAIQTTAETNKTTVVVTKPITTTTIIAQAPIDSPVPTITTKTPDIAQEPIAPPAQPIPYDNITDVVDSIKNYGQNGGSDGSGVPLYYEQCLMFERFKNDGFIYQVNSNDSITLRDDLSIFLFPYAEYEDIGIGYYVTYKGKLYHVMFYYADPYIISRTDGIAEYLKKRMGRRSDKEIIIQNQKFSESITGDGRIYASSFIDSNHYYDIVTSATEDELMEFLSVFSYEQILL